MIKYGELRALISGVTTIEGTAPDSQCFGVLVRNAENENGLGLSNQFIRTSILDIRSFDDTIDWNKTKAFVVHLAEGTPASVSAREEFGIHPRNAPAYCSAASTVVGN